MSAIKQHFVPRLYLRRYTEGKEEIWTFDKIAGKKFHTGLMLVAAEKFFYNFSEKEINELKKQFPDEEVSENLLDDLFTYQIEPVFKESLNRILNGYNSFKNEDSDYALPEEDILQLAQSLAFQYYRTKSYREGAERSKLSFLRYFSVDDVNFEKHKELSDSNKVIEHAKQIFGKSFGLAKKLKEDYYWILIENETDLPFYTSDNPLVLRKFDEDGRVIQAIHDRPDIDEYAFPLTSNLLLIIVKKEEALLDSCYHRKTKRIDDEKVILSYNEAQLHSSYRQLFCVSDNFKMIDGLITILPDTTSITIKI
ncbi:DUF4238 domain-containing protein [Metabacillus sp. JX24]|uniref:DUF4238 domain-containing protein n=1 Tax=Metabacillus sp. JX24 TaxID=3240759 RepID=UPI0035109A4F